MTEEGFFGLHPTTENLQPSELHHQLADRLNDWWQTHATKQDIFVPENFTSWSNSNGEDYYLHILTVYGLGKGGNVTPELVARFIQALNDFESTEKYQVQKQASDDFNSSVSHLEMEPLDIDLATFHFVPESRIKEIASNQDHLAVKLSIPTADILIPWDSEAVDNPDELYDVIVHELGHLQRDDPNYLLFDKTQDSIQLEEGIVQAHAVSVEQQNHRESNRSASIYYIERWMVQNLAKKLGFPTLFSVSHQKIRERMNQVFYQGNELSNPYEDFIEDLSKLSRDFAQIAEQMGSGELTQKEARNKLQEKKNTVSRNWFN